MNNMVEPDNRDDKASTFRQKVTRNSADDKQIYSFASHHVHQVGLVIAFNILVNSYDLLG